jgi:hypothetical protein
MHPDNLNMTWIADKLTHTIKLLEDDRIYIVIGKLNKPGYMDGDVSSGMFNSPSAVVFYNSTAFPNMVTRFFKPVVFFNISDASCINSTLANHTNCIDYVVYANNNTDIDPNKVKLFYNTPIEASASYDYQV